jgi:hypothetical protein
MDERRSLSAQIREHRDGGRTVRVTTRSGTDSGPIVLAAAGSTRPPT